MRGLLRSPPADLSDALAALEATLLHRVDQGGALVAIQVATAVLVERAANQTEAVMADALRELAEARTVGAALFEIVAKRGPLVLVQLQVHAVTRPYLGSLGSPRMRSPTMLRWICVVPAAIEIEMACRRPWTWLLLSIPSRSSSATSKLPSALSSPGAPVELLVVGVQ